MVTLHCLPDAVLQHIADLCVCGGMHKVLVYKGQLVLSPRYLHAFQTYRVLNLIVDYNRSQYKRDLSWALWRERNRLPVTQVSRPSHFPAFIDVHHLSQESLQEMQDECDSWRETYLP